MKTKFKTIAIIVLLAGTMLQNTSAQNLIAEYNFDGNLQDELAGSTLDKFGTENDGSDHNNATSGFATDANGAYSYWTSTLERGGGFWVDVNTDISTNYSIGIRFSFEDTEGGYRKIIDFKNMTSDNGFYFYDGGYLNFYPDQTLGNSVTLNDQVVDIIITRASDNTFKAYIVVNNVLIKELDIIDADGNAIAELVNGKPRFRFFHDDNETSSEATPGGKVYSIKIWDGPITDIQGAMNNSWTGTVSTAWSSLANWSKNSVPVSSEDVVIPDANSTDYDPVIDITTAVCNNLTINSNGILAINTGKALTVNGTLTNNAGNTGLVINSGGSLIQNTTNVAATVKRAISGDDKYHLIISPINESVVANAASCFNGAYVDRYQESAGEWVRLATGDNVVSGYGYSVNFANGTPELIFPGTLKTSPVSYTNLSYTPSAPGYGTGWNLVGNPYPCGINTALLSVPTGINATAYVWDETGSGNYITLTIGDGSATPGIIAPMQGFFVNTSSATNSLTLANAAKVHGGTFYKSSNTVPQMLTLSIAGNGYSDKTYVRFDQAATENFDQSLDAYKLSGLDEAPQLYSILPAEKAAVNTLPSYTANQHVPLGLKVGTTATYTIQVEGINSFEPSVPISLHDIKLETSVDLRLNPEYSFTASPGDAENRFRLSFATVTGRNERDVTGINVSATKGIIHVTCEGTNSGKVYLYSTAGQLLATSILTSGKATLSVTSTGVYLVKVVTGKTSYTRKLVVLQ
ncbi:MAG: T9SS type A sorting domain-containing protein [Bacteroidales bacterium]|nr:T9SS type A sorting domain-containing protein [Bacteroidales bacterium]